MGERASCIDNIKRMLRRSQTKVIFPLITYGLLCEYNTSGTTVFQDAEIRACYLHAVASMKEFLGHDMHIGGKYYDAYPSRNLPKYGVLKALGNRVYELLPPYTTFSQSLLKSIPFLIRHHIEDKLGMIPHLRDRVYRMHCSDDPTHFVRIINEHISSNPTNFEIFSFAIIKIHLEKFACRIYRDSRTSAHDRGVDLSTNFGVVYQIKKLKVLNKNTADGIYAELTRNFDQDRLNDGKIVLIIDDISKEVKNYLIDMKIQSITKAEIIHLAEQLQDAEDREKVLRIVYDEFRREYSSSI